MEMLKDPQALAVMAIPFALRVLGALAIFFIGKWVAAAVVELIRKGMVKSRMDETLAIFLANVLYGLALAIIIITALGQLGIDTTSAAAVIGGAALAIGLSLQNQLSSFAAGVMLIIFRPFKKGDFIGAGGVMGVVEEMKIVAVVLRTLDNQEVMVPNAKVWNDAITNYSRRPTRRLDLTVGIAYGSDLRKAKQLLEQMLADEPRVLKDPAPTVQVKDLGESSVDFAVRPWMNTGDWWATRCDLIERIKLAFDEAGIEIPFPQRDVHVREIPEIKPAKASNA